LKAVSAPCVPGQTPISLFFLREGSFEFRDTDGNTVNGIRRLITHLTLKDGRVLYERPAE
jgi:hypothetical protein